MKLDVYGQQIYSENDLCDIILSDPTKKLNNVFTEEIINLDQDIVNDLPKLIKYNDPKLSVTEFDEMNQSNWYLPNEYKEFDIAKWVLDQCSSPEELQRAGSELLFQVCL